MSIRFLIGQFDAFSVEKVDDYFGFADKVFVIKTRLSKDEIIESLRACMKHMLRTLSITEGVATLEVVEV